MGDNSDESEYDDEDYGNHSSLSTESFVGPQKTRSTALPDFNMEKEASDSDDNCNDTIYYERFGQDERNIKLHSPELYKSSDQESNNRYEDEDVQYDNQQSTEIGYKMEETHYSERQMYQNSSDDSSFEPVTHNNFALSPENDGFSPQKLKYESEGSRDRKSNDSPNKNSDIPKKRRRPAESESDTAVEESSEKDEQPTKKAKSNLGMELMKKMGYKDGHGLGKHQQGRVEPIEAHKQRGYSGLGFRNRELEAASMKWVEAEEHVQVEEEITWLENRYSHIPKEEEMAKWIKLGPKKRIIDNETHFCDPRVLTNILTSKNVFNTLDKVELQRAITRANPFETIRGVFFLNRAAVKMANIERACNFMFTDPKLDDGELLYFADVCAGPGGFSEYVLWRKKWHAKGFGFTLKNENDFKLTDFYAGPPETFYPFYGPKGDGNVFDLRNQEEFRNLIMEHTDGKGVHFMMSDGGFSVEGQENIQEILSKQLYLCQCLVALMIVRTGGHFVTKLFDVFTPFSAGLIYLMYRCFRQISIFKPNSSRPANSERYLICKEKLPNTESVIRHLVKVNKQLLKNDDREDVVEIVPIDFLKSEDEFTYYIKETNRVIGEKQVNALLKAAAFVENSALLELRQAEMRKLCLKYWQIPDQPRTIPKRLTPQEQVLALLGNATNILSLPPQKLTSDNISKVLAFPRSWFFVACASVEKPPTFYMGMGRRTTYYYNNGAWNQDTEMKLELPPNTLVYAEPVYEYFNEQRNQRKVSALHILDAYILGGEDISKKYIEVRHQLIKKFCKALQKPTDIHVRAKDLHPLDPEISEKLKVKKRVMKNGQRVFGYDLPNLVQDDVTPYFIPNSILLLRSTSESWNRHLSKQTGKIYVHNDRTNEAKYETERPSNAEAGFVESFKNRYVWYWPSDTNLSMSQVVNHIQQNFKVM